MNRLLQNKNICSGVGLPTDIQDVCNNPTMQSLVKEYRACKDKDKRTKKKVLETNKQDLHW